MYYRVTQQIIQQFSEYYIAYIIFHPNYNYYLILYPYYVKYTLENNYISFYYIDINPIHILQKECRINLI